MAERIRTDGRVVVLERTNLRHLRATCLGARVQLATLDLSFISVLKVTNYSIETVYSPSQSCCIILH